jgi:hypothetical protein
LRAQDWLTRRARTRVSSRRFRRSARIAVAGIRRRIDRNSAGAG